MTSRWFLDLNQWQFYFQFDDMGTSQNIFNYYYKLNFQVLFYQWVSKPKQKILFVWKQLIFGYLPQDSSWKTSSHYDDEVSVHSREKTEWSVLLTKEKFWFLIYACTFCFWGNPLQNIKIWWIIMTTFPGNACLLWTIIHFVRLILNVEKDCRASFASQ